MSRKFLTNSSPNPTQIAIAGADLLVGWETLEHARVSHEEEARRATAHAHHSNAMHESRLQAAS